ncbi:MAG: FtsX-like permease family protein [Alphaproteobacteria bacterium]|nr:MAG: FtsX-like permease family protein [Alphaproteobacteria bacterium]
MSAPVKDQVKDQVRDHEGAPGRTPAPGPGTAARLALRDLRGSIKSFRVMIACLALGVAAVAGIGSFTAAIGEGLERDAQALLGGDLDIRLTHRRPSAAHLAWLKARGRVSAAVRMRSMARPAGKAAPNPATRDRTLVELKAVDRAYPLYGTVVTDPPMRLNAALARDADGAFGAVVGRGLLARLGLARGGKFRIGGADFRIKAVLLREPDQSSGRFKLGPRVLISDRALDATGLVQPGSLIRFHTRLATAPGTDVVALQADLTRAFPNAGWRVRNTRAATPHLRRHIDRAALFFTLVGLAALLIGGIGVAGAVTGYLEGKRETIATLKCLGATGGFIFAMFALEVGVVALMGIGLGLIVGAGLPALGTPGLAAFLPVIPRIAVYPGPLMVAAGYGIAVAVLFTLWPLARAREVTAAELFRGLVARPRFRPPAAVIIGLALALAAIVGLALATSVRPAFALWFMAGTAMAFLLFLGLAKGISRLAGAAARRLAQGGVRRPRLSLALANIHRPGAPARPIIVALGVGLTVFVALVQVEGNLRRQITERIPANAPAFYFIDIQPGQVAGFEAAVKGVPGAGRIKSVPTMRGRIVKVGGKPVETTRVAHGARWAVRGDRGLTYMGARPEGTKIVSGRWWAAGYKGPALISLDARIARGLGIGVGDTLTVNVLGREITGRIANTRRVDWSTLGLNFVIIFSPGVLEDAPQTFIATVEALPRAEEAVIRAVTDRFANITAISVREALAAIMDALDNIAAAARAVAALALIAGILVLAGALAAGLRERTRDAVILKVTGVRRRDLCVAYLIEYGIAGAAAGLVAAVAGSLAGYFILSFIMDADWVILPGPAAAVLVASAGGVVVLGFAGTWRALAQKPAPVLRRL